MNFLAASLSSGLLSAASRELVHQCFLLQQLFRASLPLSSAWLQALLAGVLALQLGVCLLA